MRVYGKFSVNSIKNFKEIKTVAINQDCTVKDFLEIAEGDSLYRVFVYNKNGGYKIIEPTEVAKIIGEKNLAGVIQHDGLYGRRSYVNAQGEYVHEGNSIEFASKRETILLKRG